MPFYTHLGDEKAPDKLALSISIVKLLQGLLRQILTVPACSFIEKVPSQQFAISQQGAAMPTSGTQLLLPLLECACHDLQLCLFALALATM